jgi:hypothetical protein
MKPIDQEFQYYLTHQGELVRQYNGKYLVIKNEMVIGVFDSEVDAVNETIKTQKLGTFLVQKCEPGLEIQVYHSRVAFA